MKRRESLSPERMEQIRRRQAAIREAHRQTLPQIKGGDHHFHIRAGERPVGDVRTAIEAEIHRRCNIAAPVPEPPDASSDPSDSAMPAAASPPDVAPPDPSPPARASRDPLHPGRTRTIRIASVSMLATLSALESVARTIPPPSRHQEPADPTTPATSATSPHEE